MGDVPVLLHYGVSDQEAWDVGLACGGEIEIFLQPFVRMDFSRIKNAIYRNEDIYYWTIIKGQDKLLGKIIYEEDDLSKFSKVTGVEFFSNSITTPLEIIIITRCSKIQRCIKGFNYENFISKKGIDSIYCLIIYYFRMRQLRFII